MIRLIALVRATVTAVTLLAGVPVLLIALGGSPLPAGAPSPVQVQMWLDDPLRPQYVPATVRVLAWLIWALLAAAVLAAMVSRLSRWRWTLLAAYLPGPVQGLAATLLGAATVTTTVAAPAAHAAAPATATDPITSGPETTVNASVAATRVAPANDHHAHNPSSTVRTVSVGRGDTLWDIAADRLGNPHHWKQIYRLNIDRYPEMRGGDHIEPGWTLTLPSRATTPAGPPSPPESILPPPTPPRSTTAATPDADHGSTPPLAASGASAAAPSVPANGTSASTPTPDTGSANASSAQHPEPDANRRHEPTSGVPLAGGSWIDLGLAFAIAAAAALVWKHRRHRYVRRTLTTDPHLDEPDMAPMPPVVRQIRRRLRNAAHPAEEEKVPTSEEKAVGVEDRYEDAHAADTDEGDIRPDDDSNYVAHPASSALDTSGDASCPTPRPVVPSLAHPLSQVWPPAGLGLTGPGSHAAARGFLAAALAAGGAAEPDQRTSVIMPAATAVTLLGADTAIPDTPRLSVTASLDEALDLLEQQTLHRSRVLYSHEVDTLAQLRTTDPSEQALPPILLLADAGSRHQRARIAAVLTQGQRLDIHGILLGTWPDGDTAVVADDGTTTPDMQAARHGQHTADIGRLAILNSSETGDLLRTLAESHTGDPQPSAPTQVAPVDMPTTSPAAQDNRAHTVTRLPVEPPLRDLLSEARAAATSSHSAHVDQLSLRRPLSGASIDGAGDAIPAGHGSADASPDTAPQTRPATAPEQAGQGDTAGRVAVTVLGPAGIRSLPAGVTPRKKSLEVLVYLAVHDGTATLEAILDDVLPDAPASKAPGRLYTYISDLRTIMRRTAGPGPYLTHPGHRYALDHDTVEVDLWHMRAALRDATHSHDPDERITALRKAVDACRGPLAEGADYEWIEPYREAVRRQALDAHLALADALTGQPAEQVTVLDAAIGHDPYAEELYQQAMHARAALGHLDAIRTLRRALTRALAEIDAQPDAETITLADRLLATPQQPRHQTDLPEGPHPTEGAAA